MAKKKTRKKKPRGNLPSDLRKQIYVESPGLWAGALTPDEITRQIYQQADKKFVDLMKHYNIPLQSPEKWWALSFYLASDMGLMDVTLGPRPRGRGRPRIWGAAGTASTTLANSTSMPSPVVVPSALLYLRIAKLAAMLFQSGKRALLVAAH